MDPLGRVTYRASLIRYFVLRTPTLMPGRSALATRRPASLGPPSRSAHGAAWTSAGRTAPARPRTPTSADIAAAARLSGDANTVRSEWLEAVVFCGGRGTGRETTCDTTSPALSALARASVFTSVPQMRMTSPG